DGLRTFPGGLTYSTECSKALQGRQEASDHLGPGGLLRNERLHVDRFTPLDPPREPFDEAGQCRVPCPRVRTISAPI
ncbi:hypothetical protein ACYOEI_34085, partial [Singulisphaera rosea]